MTEPILTATKRPVTREVAEHPLATQTGIALMCHLIEADQVWSGCTKPQRALLAQLCPPVAERLLAEGALTAEQMPVLPDGTRQSMRDGLARRGLVDGQGRLTGPAVHAWFYTQRFGKGGEE